ncbi:hypothetical protein EDD27_7785 [Nonomuraea polychroma]|uniref:Uncharacterized protein n=1 Tax=Nonomuraea polychroma TaxID=46176 RepID=A0A438MGN1_9ACTN|nr:hypothetical protein EDD27_7785 [Nonomuraea polychroma]
MQAPPGLAADRSSYSTSRLILDLSLVTFCSAGRLGVLLGVQGAIGA